MKMTLTSSRTTRTTDCFVDSQVMANDVDDQVEQEEEDQFAIRFKDHTEE